MLGRQHTQRVAITLNFFAKMTERLTAWRCSFAIHTLEQHLFL